MPDWIKATFSVFACIGGAALLSIGLAVIATTYGAPVAIGMVAALIAVGVPTFFYVVLG